MKPDAQPWLVLVLIVSPLAVTFGSATGPSDALLILTVQPGAALSVSDRVHALGLDATPFPRVDAVVAVAGPARQGALASIDGVLDVRPNLVVRPLLDRTVPYVHAPQVWRAAREEGHNVSVLVLDTGVDGTHPDVRLGANLVQNVVPTRAPSGLPTGSVENDPVTDVGGHGTHVAGIVGASGTGSGGRYRGVAPSVRLVGFSAGVTDPTTQETLLDGAGLLAGFDYAIANRDRFGIRIVSNSWGSSGNFDPDGAIEHATLRLYQAGIVVVFAAGNEGRDGLGTMNPYSVAPWVLSVGAGDLLDRRLDFSSMGTDPQQSGRPFDHPDLLAPGGGVVSAKATTDTGRSIFAPQPESGGVYTSKSGTSMATPHVAGAAALLLSDNPRLSPDEVYDLLVASTRPLDARTWEVGRGYLDVAPSFDAAQRLDGNLAAFLAGARKYQGPASGDPSYARDPVVAAALPPPRPSPAPTPPSSSPTTSEPPGSAASVSEPAQRGKDASHTPSPLWVAFAAVLVVATVARRRT